MDITGGQVRLQRRLQFTWWTFGFFIIIYYLFYAMDIISAWLQKHNIHNRDTLPFPQTHEEDGEYTS